MSTPRNETSEEEKNPNNPRITDYFLRCDTMPDFPIGEERTEETPPVEEKTVPITNLDSYFTRKNSKKDQKRTKGVEPGAYSTPTEPIHKKRKKRY